MAGRAILWWEKNAMVWNSIRNFWIDAGELPGPTFSYHTTQNGVGLSRIFDELENTKSTPQAVNEALAPYLSVSR